MNYTVNLLMSQSVIEERISDSGQRFYVCGPPPFMDAVNAALAELGARAESLVFEQ